MRQIDIGRSGDTLVLIDGQRFDREESRQARLDFDVPPPRRRRTSRPESFHARGQHITADELAAGEARARGQEAEILRFFRERARQRFTPAEVNAHFPAWPLTSVRARITTLERKGLLVHHVGDRRPGRYGATNSTWSLLA